MPKVFLLNALSCLIMFTNNKSSRWLAFKTTFKFDQ